MGGHGALISSLRNPNRFKVMVSKLFFLT
jgi:S-formylglutathione hydrolase FrmB